MKTPRLPPLRLAPLASRFPQFNPPNLYIQTQIPPRSFSLLTPCDPPPTRLDFLFVGAGLAPPACRVLTTDWRDASKNCTMLHFLLRLQRKPRLPRRLIQNSR